MNNGRSILDCGRRLVIPLIGLAILGGCRAPARDKIPEPAPVPPVTMGTAEPKSFFSDPRARQPGDMLTVIITEAASVAQTARTQADKAQSLSGTVNHSATNQSTKSAEIDSHYDGGGSIERTGQMLGKLAVRVISVDAYGNLSIAGEQEIVINNERQKMRLEGFVRPSDIDTDNTIASWRVSGAKIALEGHGFLSRKQSPGPLSQLLSYFGL
jgi:flagellar L-ring protein FlgH